MEYNYQTPSFSLLDSKQECCRNRPEAKNMGLRKAWQGFPCRNLAPGKRVSRHWVAGWCWGVQAQDEDMRGAWALGSGMSGEPSSTSDQWCDL